MKLKREEILRKLLHIFALLMPAGIFYLPEIFNLSKWFPPILLSIIFFISFMVEIIRLKNSLVQKYFLKFFKTMMRKKEDGTITGSTYIIGASFLCSFLFVDRPEISFISLSVFILGDAAAALIGIEFGKIKIRGKSLEGSFACFLVAFFLLYFIFPYFPGVLEYFSGSFDLVMALKLAFMFTILEFYSIKIKNFELNDNLYVPVLCGVAISFI